MSITQDMPAGTLDPIIEELEEMSHLLRFLLRLAARGTPVAPSMN